MKFDKIAPVVTTLAVAYTTSYGIRKLARGYKTPGLGWAAVAGILTGIANAIGKNR